MSVRFQRKEAVLRWQPFAAKLAGLIVVSPTVISVVAQSVRRTFRGAARESGGWHSIRIFVSRLTELLRT